MTNHRSRGEPMRFINEVALHHTGDECLTWPYGRDRDGYATISIDNKKVGAHRYVCKLAKGAPPTAGHEAAHSCGKGHEACIAPDHLSWKTRAENAADSLAHGTLSRGERHGRAKLTEAEARAILSMKGAESPGNLAERFGVSRHTISRIHNGLNWACLSEERASA